MNPSRRRALQLFGLVGFAAVAAKTVKIQVVDGPALALKAKAERTVTWVNRAPRGTMEIGRASCRERV